MKQRNISAFIQDSIKFFRLYTHIYAVKQVGRISVNTVRQRVSGESKMASITQSKYEITQYLSLTRACGNLYAIFYTTGKGRRHRGGGGGTMPLPIEKAERAMWGHGPPRRKHSYGPPPSKSVDMFWYVAVSGPTYFFVLTYTVLYRGKFQVYH